MERSVSDSRNSSSLDPLDVFPLALDHDDEATKEVTARVSQSSLMNRYEVAANFLDAR